MTRLLTLLLFLPLLSCGQAPTASALLTQAEQRFAGLSSFSGRVQFTHGPQGQKEWGKIHYQGSRYHFDYPEDQTICDGKMVMNWAKGFGSVDVQAVVPGMDLSYGGLYRLHRQGYTASIADTAGDAHRVVLHARDEGLVASRVELLIDKRSHLITGYSLILPMGRLDYTVADIVQNPALDPKLFEIDWAFVKKVQAGEVPPIEHSHEAEEGHEDHPAHEGHDH